MAEQNVTRTVSQYIAANQNRAEEAVAEAYRLAEVNDQTPVEDLISDLLHLLESIHDVQGSTDARADALAGVERAIGHWWSESVYAIEHGDESSDVLGGIPIYRAEAWVQEEADV